MHPKGLQVELSKKQSSKLSSPRDVVTNKMQNNSQINRKYNSLHQLSSKIYLGYNVP